MYAGTELMRIASNGNVGIGTTSPGAKLHVQSSVSDGIILRTSADVEPFIALQRNSGSSGVGVVRLISGGDIYFDNGATGAAQSTKMALGSSGALRLNSYGSNSFTGTAAYALAVDSSGNVIETAVQGSPTGGSGTGNYLAKWETSSTLTDSPIYDNGGNIGIGTANPSHPLHVEGFIASNNSSNASGLLVRKAGSTIGFIGQSGGWVGDSTDDLSISGETGKNIRFYTNGSITERMRIDTSGNVGIGTTSPLVKLDVSGTARIGGKTIYSKGAGSVDTTGYAVAGLLSSSNGTSATFKFEMHGGAGNYQRVVYSCYNASGTWYVKKVIDEGTNQLDVEASPDGTTITFTFKAVTTTQLYTPIVEIEHLGAAIDPQYL